MGSFPKCKNMTIFTHLKLSLSQFTQYNGNTDPAIYEASIGYIHSIFTHLLSGFDKICVLIELNKISYFYYSLDHFYLFQMFK